MLNFNEDKNMKSIRSETTAPIKSTNNIIDDYSFVDESDEQNAKGLDSTGKKDIQNLLSENELIF